MKSILSYIKILLENTNVVIKPTCTMFIFKDNTYSEVLLVHRRDYDIWAFPGGGMESGETYGQAAVRESKEEVNVVVTKYVPVTNVTQEFDMRDGSKRFRKSFIAIEWNGEPKLVDHESDLDDMKFESISNLKNIKSYHKSFVINWFLENYDKIINHTKTEEIISIS